MHFLFQVNLKYVPKSVDFPDFPDVGTLFVFVETMIAPEYFHTPLRPIYTGQGARVIYVPASTENVPPRAAPPLPDLMVDHGGDVGTLNDELVYCYESMRDAYGVTNASGLHRWPMFFVIGDTFPKRGFLRGQDPSFDVSKIENMKVAVKTDEKRSTIVEKCYSYGGKTKDDIPIQEVPHHMFGVSNTQLFPSKEYQQKRAISSPERPEMPYLTQDHVTLFQIIGLDEEIGYEYLQQYPISFWIHRDDLAAGNFNNVQVWEEII